MPELSPSIGAEAGVAVAARRGLASLCHGQGLYLGPPSLPTEVGRMCLLN